MAIIQRAYKVKLYPSDNQRQLYAQHAGYARYVYNWGLARWCETLRDAPENAENGDKFLHWMTLKKQWNAEKYTITDAEGNPALWIRDMHQDTGEFAMRNLGKALSNFWREWQKGNKRVKAGAKVKCDLPLTVYEGFPRFKGKYGRASFQIRRLTVEYSRVKFPPAIGGWVKFREPGYIPLEDVKYNTWTVSRSGDDWFLSVQVEESATITRATGGPVGVDAGVKELAVASDGTFYANPKELARQQKKLRRLQRKLSRQQKGGANYNKTKGQIAKVHARIANVRSWHTNNASSDIVKRGAPDDQRPAAIGLENLNVRGMVKNHRLARAVADANMSELRRQIEYKAAWGGTDVVVADRFYPSTQTCSNCGVIRNGEDKVKLSDRVFRCPECGFEIDRDLNAARNLERLAR